MRKRLNIEEAIFADIFLKNPKFVFDLTDPDPEDENKLCPVIVALAQNNGERRQEWEIGFRIYKVNIHIK